MTGCDTIEAIKSASGLDGLSAWSCMVTGVSAVVLVVTSKACGFESSCRGVVESPKGLMVMLTVASLLSVLPSLTLYVKLSFAVVLISSATGV